MILHVNVKEKMVTLVQTLPGIKITQILSQEKKKQFWFSGMSVEMTMEHTDVKLRAMRMQRMKHQLI